MAYWDELSAGSGSNVELGSARQDYPKEIGAKGSWLDRPTDVYLAVLNDAITQIQVDKALVRDASLYRHILEVGNHFFGKPHRDGLL